MTNTAKQLATRIKAGNAQFLQTGPVQFVVDGRAVVDGRRLLYDTGSSPSVGDVVAYVWDGRIGVIVATIRTATLY